MPGKCPTCLTPLDTGGRSASCHTCRGLWVGPDALAEMIAEMQGRAVPAAIGFVDSTLPAREVARACPTCETTMRHGRLDGVEVDRCDPHGYWFDADELGQVLKGEHVVPRAAPGLEPAHEPRAGVIEMLRGWWTRG